MSDLSRREMLKGVLASSLATWILSQDDSARGQGPENDAESSTLSVKATDRYATQRLAQQIRPRHEDAAFGTRIDQSQSAWSIQDLGLPNSGEPIWKNLDIYDIHGELLFRDKTHRLPEGTELRLRTAASSRLATPVWQAGIGPPRDIDGWMRTANAIARTHGLNPVEGPRSLVCYCYPKLGLLCNRPKQESQVILDLVAASHERFLPHEVSKRSPNKEGSAVWSPFDRLKKVSSAKEHFRESVSRLESFWGEQSKLATLDSRAVAAANKTQQYTLHIDPEVQENDWFCAVATAVMLLGFHNIQKTQRQVAAFMNPTPEDGCTVETQVMAYGEISKKGVPAVQTLEAISDEAPSSEKSRIEIVEHRMPFRVGTEGHARAVAGWRRLGDGTVEQLVYDPYTGDTTWENAWDILLNFVYVRPKLYN